MYPPTLTLQDKPSMSINTLAPEVANPLLGYLLPAWYSEKHSLQDIQLSVNSGVDCIQEPSKTILLIPRFKWPNNSYMKKQARNCWSKEHPFKLTCVERLQMCCHVWRQEYQFEIVAFSGAIVTRRVGHQETNSPPVHLGIEVPEPLANVGLFCHAGLLLKYINFIWLVLALQNACVSSTCLWTTRSIFSVLVMLQHIANVIRSFSDFFL